MTLLTGRFCLWLVRFVLCAVTEPYQSLREVYLIKIKAINLRI